jgi:hypothetical protein
LLRFVAITGVLSVDALSAIVTKNGHPVKVSRSEKDIEDMLNKEVSSLETSSYTCKRNGKAVFVYDKNKLIYMYSVIILPLN